MHQHLIRVHGGAPLSIYPSPAAGTGKKLRDIEAPRSGGAAKPCLARRLHSVRQRRPDPSARQFFSTLFYWTSRRPSPSSSSSSFKAHAHLVASLQRKHTAPHDLTVLSRWHPSCARDGQSLLSSNRAPPPRPRGSRSHLQLPFSRLFRLHSAGNARITIAL